MSATTIHSTLHAQTSTTKARFLAPGTHQRADAKDKGKGQGALPSKGPAKSTKGRATEPVSAIEDEAFAPGDLVLIPLSRLVPSAFNMRKSGGEDVGELAALIKAQGLLQNLVVHPDETKPEKIRTALEATNLPGEALIMPWKGVKFDPKTHQNTLGQGILVQVQDGKYQVIYPFELAAAEVRWPLPAWGK